MIPQTIVRTESPQSRHWRRVFARQDAFIKWHTGTRQQVVSGWEGWWESSVLKSCSGSCSMAGYVYRGTAVCGWAPWRSNVYLVIADLFRLL